MFTASRAIGLYVYDALKGAGSTITTQIGIAIADKTQGTTNFALTTGAGLVSFGDNVDFNQHQGLEFVMENRTSDPGSPVTGQLWIRTDL